ncbi:hypothetical protein WSSLDB02_01110 [Weissella soli]|nr:hypothetical protein WSSLDB02_01110 [Weissella soli]
MIIYLFATSLSHDALPLKINGIPNRHFKPYQLASDRLPLNNRALLINIKAGSPNWFARFDQIRT